MGTIVISVLVSLIAIIGLIYFQDTGPQRTKGPQSLIIGRYLTEQDRCNCLSFLVLTDEIVEGVTLAHQDTKKAPAEICKCLTAIYKKTLQISCSVGVL